MFSQSLQTMITSIQTGLAAVGKKINDYTSSSVIGNILAATASTADELNTSISMAQQQAYLSTATGTDLDNKAADYGIIRKQATPAQWTFVATKQSTAVQQYTIPAGSLITTIPSKGQTPITFTVNSLVYFPVGSTAISIPVTCTTAGSIGNIPTGTQLLWGSAVPGVDGVQFADASTGKAGIDTETDDQLRTRALNAFKGLAIGTDTWYIQQALKVTGVTSATVVPGYLTPNGIAIYIAQGNSLPTNDQITQVQALVGAGRIQLDKPTVLAPTPLVINETMSITVIAGNDQATAQADVGAAIATVINNVGLGAKATSGYIYPSQMVTSALAQIGIADAGSVTLNGGSSPIAVSASQLPQAGTITVTVVTP